MHVCTRGKNESFVDLHFNDFSLRERQEQNGNNHLRNLVLFQLTSGCNLDFLDRSTLLEICQIF